MCYPTKTTQLVANIFALLFTVTAGIHFIFSSLPSILFWLIPVMEIGIVALLFKRKTKMLGLYVASFWFVLFTYYILFLLTSGTYEPCACGGSLLFMSWGQQLLFNTVCILISAGAISFNKPNTHALSHQIKFTAPFNN